MFYGNWLWWSVIFFGLLINFKVILIFSLAFDECIVVYLLKIECYENVCAD